MKIEVRLFAGMRDQIGCDVVELDVAEPATVGNVRRQLDVDYPGVGAILRHSHFAVEHAYASEETLIPDGANVACIPPVSGG